MNRAFAVAVLAAASSASAAPVRLEMVKDLDTSPAAAPASSAPQRFRAIGGNVYFAASTPQAGTELHVIDGGSAPARLVADLAPGGASSSPTAVGLAGDRLIVAADDGYVGMQFWSIDAAGTATRLTSKNMPTWGPLPAAFGSVGNTLVFSSYDNALWASDGTVAGTQPLNRYGNWEGVPGCSVNGRVVMLDRDITGSRIVASDATPAGTLTLATSAHDEHAWSASDGSHCYFAIGGYRWEIWRTDGTAAGTSIWRDGEGDLCGVARLGGQFYVLAAGSSLRLINADTQAVAANLPQPVCPSPRTLWAAGGRLVFVGPPATPDDPAARALYVSDGSSSGTQRLAVPANVYAGYPVQAAVMGQRFVFQAGYSGVYTLDTSTATMTPLPARFAGLENGDIASLGGTAFLSANDTIHGYEPWRSDGTPAGTALLEDVWSSSNDGLSWTDPALPAAVLNDRLYFVRLASQAQGGLRELWRTDGTAAGTHGIAPVAVGNRSVGQVVALDEGIAFSVNSYDGATGSMAVYRADADLSGIATIWSDASIASLLQAVPGGGVLFDCDGSGSGNVCASAPGQAQAALVAPGLQTGRRVVRLGQLGTAALFLVSEGGSGDLRGLWRSDGTAPGTFRIATDLYLPFYGLSGGSPALTHASALWFLACDAVPEQCGLYLTDGTTAGTRRVAAVGSAYGDIEPLGNRVAVLAGLNTVQLTVSDGSEAGTQVLGSFAPSGRIGLAGTGNRVYFVAGEPSAPLLYVSDGTLAGTGAVSLPPQTRPVYAPPLALGDDTVMFRCVSPATGEELCVADSVSGAIVAHDLFPGPAASAVQFLGKTTDSAYFAADDGRHGRELWRVQRLADPIFRDGFQ